MPKYGDPKMTWRHSAGFKIKAVDMSYEEGIQVQQVAKGLGIWERPQNDLVSSKSTDEN